MSRDGRRAIDGDLFALCVDQDGDRPRALQRLDRQGHIGRVKPGVETVQGCGPQASPDRGRPGVDSMQRRPELIGGSQASLEERHLRGQSDRT